MKFIYFDYPQKFQLSFQDPASITAEGLINLHHDIMFYLTFIIIFVIAFLRETLVFFVKRPNSWASSIKNLKLLTPANTNNLAGMEIIFIFVLFFLSSLEFGILFTLVLLFIFLFILFIIIPEFVNHFILYVLSVFYFYYNKIETKNISFLTIYNINKDHINHHSNLEIIWTLIPTAILCMIALPSIRLLYAVDEAIFCPLTVKIIGHQWYWSYEYGKLNMQLSNSNALKEISFDSYMIPYDDLEKGHIRLLSVDNSLVLPIWLNIRLLVTSEDVLHSWAVPSLGIKVDAVPGRLNQNFIYIKRPGVFFGQCSEICGTNHGFMPIAVNACYPDTYVYWYLHMLLGSSQINYNNNLNVLKSIN